MTRSMCSTGRSARSRSWRGVSMITSCAPTPFIRSWTPIPLRSSSPSMRSAGNLFATTRTSQPGRLGGPPPGRSARISGGVLLSFPSQKGQSAPAGISAWRGKLAGARLRSEAMMTQRFWIGSCRSSGMTLPLDRFHDSRGGTDLRRDEVILRGVFLHHAPGVEARDQRRHRPAHPGDPLARNAAAVALPELRDHLFVQHGEQVLAVAAVLLLDRLGVRVGSDGEAVGAVVALAPPAVEDAQVEAAVAADFLAARAAGFQRAPRRVQPDVASGDHLAGDVHVVVFDEDERALQLRVLRQVDDLLDVALPFVVARVRLAGEDELQRALRGQPDDLVELLEDQRSPLVGREAARESDGESIGIEQLVEGDEV